MNPQEQYLQNMTRRHFFGKGALGLGTAALASLMPPTLQGAVAPISSGNRGLPGLPHFAPKAKRAIYLFMAGAPCQMDLLDYKPEMNALYDTDLPQSVFDGLLPTTMTSGQARFPIAPSKYSFSQHGRSDAWISELLPYTASMADDIAIIRSLHTEAINHDPAITYICTGDQLPGRASLGSWLSYGLGSMNDELPTFVVMTPTWTGRRNAQAIYNRLWGSGFLRSKHQGVSLRSSGEPVLFLENPPGVSDVMRHRMLDSLARLNDETFEDFGDPETQTRIAQYEMAGRMQASVPELVDLSDEPQHVLDMYGPEVTKPGTFAASALLTRRMIERDVRFVQIFHRGWDQHGNVGGDLPKQCNDVDQPCWALIQDLKQRGLLDETLVVWGGEFGRTVYSQGALSHDNYGRDHLPNCFSIWMAGGGIKGGIVHGTTDPFCCQVIEDPVHINDMNATILHCLGIDHKRFNVKVSGLDRRLTGVEEHNPVEAILA